MDFQTAKAVFVEAASQLAFLKGAEWGRAVRPLQLRFANSRG
jgi:hypothetical protein